MIDILVIGSGPAGYTAALYSARAGRKVQIIVGPQMGGQLMITSSIENYPGFEDISGAELMDKMMSQSEKVGAEIVYDTVTSVDFSKKPFLCIGESGAVYEARAVIIATGASARWLGVPGEKRYMGTGVSACATCDGFFFRNKDVAVIGGGNTAVEEAVYLTNFAKSVTLIHRRKELRAEKIMQERLFNNPKIKVIWDSVVVDILGNSEKVTDLLLKNVITGEENKKSVDGVFIAIGHEPATSIFKGQIDTDENGYIKTFGDTSKTSVNGVFAAGDVRNPVYRQAIVSAGQGCIASIDADKFLSVNF